MKEQTQGWLILIFVAAIIGVMVGYSLNLQIINVNCFDTGVEQLTESSIQFLVKCRLS